MFDRCLVMMKSLIDEQLKPSTEISRKIHAATNCEELWGAVERDFWVVTPCHSVRKPGHVMEGTRLTLVVRCLLVLLWWLVLRVFLNAHVCVCVCVCVYPRGSGACARRL